MKKKGLQRNTCIYKIRFTNLLDFTVYLHHVKGFSNGSHAGFVCLAS